MSSVWGGGVLRSKSGCLRGRNLETHEDCHRHGHVNLHLLKPLRKKGHIAIASDRFPSKPRGNDNKRRAKRKWKLGV